MIFKIKLIFVNKKNLIYIKLVDPENILFSSYSDISSKNKYNTNLEQEIINLIPDNIKIDSENNKSDLSILEIAEDIENNPTVDFSKK